MIGATSSAKLTGFGFSGFLPLALSFARPSVFFAFWIAILAALNALSSSLTAAAVAIDVTFSSAAVISLSASSNSFFRTWAETGARLFEISAISARCSLVSSPTATAPTSAAQKNAISP